MNDIHFVSWRSMKNTKQQMERDRSDGRCTRKNSFAATFQPNPNERKSFPMHLPVETTLPASFHYTPTEDFRQTEYALAVAAVPPVEQKEALVPKPNRGRPL